VGGLPRPAEVFEFAALSNEPEGATVPCLITEYEPGGGDATGIIRERLSRAAAEGSDSVEVRGAESVSDGIAAAPIS
jgi:hypothetical protein